VIALDAMPTPDLATIKQTQQATWSGGDYHMLRRGPLAARRLLAAGRTVAAWRMNTTNTSTP
jgi:hypothetical protein